MATTGVFIDVIGFCVVMGPDEAKEIVSLTLQPP